MKKCFVLGAAALGAVLTATSAVQAILPTRVLSRLDITQANSPTSQVTFPANIGGLVVRNTNEIYVLAVGSGGTPGLNQVTNFSSGPGTATTTRIVDLPSGLGAQGLSYNATADRFAFYNTGDNNLYTVTRSASQTVTPLVTASSLNTWARNGVTTTGSAGLNNVSIDSNGTITFYNNGPTTAGSNGRAIGQATSAATLSPLVTQADLALAVNGGSSGSATLATFSIASNGDLILGNSAGNIYRYTPGTTPSTTTVTTIATASQIGNAFGGVFQTTNSNVRFVNTFPSILAAPDGNIYFALQGSSGTSPNKAIGVVNPATSSIRLLTNYNEMAIAAGQADIFGNPSGTPFNVGQLTWYDNAPAYAVFTAQSPDSIGFYVIPEPTALGLLAPVGALLLRRRGSR